MQDGNIHCHIDNVSRADGKGGERFAIAKAAYNAGERLWSERAQRHVDFDNRADVVCSIIRLPDGAPAWAADREALWNKVDLSAQRKDARLAKSIEAAITRDIPRRLYASLLHDFIAPFVALGCAVDGAVHEDGTGHNPHLHVLLTTREFLDDGFGSKITALEARSFVKNVRKQWADLSNAYLQKAGSPLRVDHRSYKARGIGAEPTQHRGPDQKERRIQREHARLIREERNMANPDTFDRQQYPLLTQRGHWPPEPEASPDMSPQERDEHHRYWQDQKIEQHEEKARVQPDQRSLPATKQAWYEEALSRAKGERPSRELPVPDPERDADRLEYERGLAVEALREPLSDKERHLLESLTGHQDNMREQIETLIHARRVAALRERDERQLLEQVGARLDPSQQAILREYLAPSVERDMERPVPGPLGELLAPRELDAAQDRMLGEYHREEPDRER